MKKFAFSCAIFASLLTFASSYAAAIAKPPCFPSSTSINLDKAKKLVFIGNQLAIDPKTGELSEGNIPMATNFCLDKFGQCLKAESCDWKNVVTLNVYFRNKSDLPQIQTEIAKRFAPKNLPVVNFYYTEEGYRITISGTSTVPRK